MSPDPPTASASCQETSGFLFKHACGYTADLTCAHCHKPICNRHARALEEQFVCISCSRHPGRTSTRSTRRPRSGRTYYDDPYDYADYHYPGYGHYRGGYWGAWFYSQSQREDRNELTEADAENLQVEGDETFEQDMGES